jgi:hypothetical protein
MKNGTEGSILRAVNTQLTEGEMTSETCGIDLMVIAICFFFLSVKTVVMAERSASRCRRLLFQANKAGKARS